MSPESNKTLIAREYFEIRNILNRNNKTKNESTELVFELREDDEEYFIIIKSSQADHGLRLASYDKERQEWKIFNSAEHINFYRYMFQKIFRLNDLDGNSINEELTIWLNRLWVI